MDIFRITQFQRKKQIKKIPNQNSSESKKTVDLDPDEGKLDRRY